MSEWLEQDKRSGESRKGKEVVFKGGGEKNNRGVEGAEAGVEGIERGGEGDKEMLGGKERRQKGLRRRRREGGGKVRRRIEEDRCGSLEGR